MTTPEQDHYEEMDWQSTEEPLDLKNSPPPTDQGYLLIPRETPESTPLLAEEKVVASDTATFSETTTGTVPPQAIETFFAHPGSPESHASTFAADSDLTDGSRYPSGVEVPGEPAFGQDAEREEGLDLTSCERRGRRLFTEFVCRENSWKHIASAFPRLKPRIFAVNAALFEVVLSKTLRPSPFVTRYLETFRERIESLYKAKSSTVLALLTLGPATGFLFQSPLLGLALFDAQETTLKSLQLIADIGPGAAPLTIADISFSRMVAFLRNLLVEIQVSSRSRTVQHAADFFADPRLQQLVHLAIVRRPAGWPEEGFALTLQRIQAEEEARHHAAPNSARHSDLTQAFQILRLTLESLYLNKPQEGLLELLAINA